MGNYTSFLSKVAQLHTKIATSKNQLLSLLGQYEPYGAARDEVERSSSTLAGLAKEFEAVKIDITDLKIATFFPLNLPLYSLVLFAIAPSAFAKKCSYALPESCSRLWSS